MEFLSRPLKLLLDCTFTFARRTSRSQYSNAAKNWSRSIKRSDNHGSAYQTRPWLFVGRVDGDAAIRSGDAHSWSPDGNHKWCFQPLAALIYKLGIGQAANHVQPAKN